MQNQFRFPDLFENLRIEFDRLNNEYSVCKRQRDEFEKLLQNQIMEAKNMESTINDLKNKQIMAKRQYYEEINTLKEKYGVIENPGEERITQSAKRLKETASSSVSNPNKQIKYQMPLIEEGGNIDSPPHTESPRRSGDTIPHGGSHDIINQINSPSAQMYGQIKNPQMGMQIKNPSMPGSQPYPYGGQHQPQYQQQQPPYGSQKMSGPHMGGQHGKHVNIMNKPPTKQVYAPPPPQQKFQQGSYHNIQVVPGSQYNQVPVHSIQQIPQQMPQQKQIYAKKPIVNSPVKYPINPSGGGGYPMPKNVVEKVPIKKVPAKNPKVPVLQMVKVSNPKNGDWQIKKNSLVESPLNVDLMHNLNHDSVVCCVKFSGDGRYLATGCNKRAFIYDTDTGEVAHTLYDQNAHDKTDLYIRSVCFSPNGKHIATGAEDKTVKVWDIETKTNTTFAGHTHDIYSLDYSPDGKIIASGSGDKKVKVWNVEENKCCYTFGDDELGPKDGVTSVAISPDGRLVAAGSLDKIVRIWDLSTGFFLERYEGHEDSVYSVSFSPDGKTLVSGSLDKTLKIWDLAGGRSRAKCVSSFEGHSDYVLSVAFSKDGRWIVSGSKDRNIIFWDPRTTLPHLMLQGHRNSVISVDVSPVSKLFASGSGDFRARLWNFT